MPRTFEIITGHGRRPLIFDVSSQISQGGSRDFGQFEVDRYSRLTGYIVANSVGNTGLVFRRRFAITSGGPWQATSSTTVSSGAGGFSGTVIDRITNFGRFLYADIVSVDSTTTYSILLMGEPMP